MVDYARAVITTLVSLATFRWHIRLAAIALHACVLVRVRTCYLVAIFPRVSWCPVMWLSRWRRSQPTFQSSSWRFEVVASRTTPWLKSSLRWRCPTPSTVRLPPAAPEWHGRFRLVSRYQRGCCEQSTLVCTLLACVRRGTLQPCR